VLDVICIVISLKIIKFDLNSKNKIMKKEIIFILILTPLLFMSCENPFARYCASCTEMSTLYVADDYCGTSSQVDIYINDLESYNPAYPDQNWSCYKQAD